MDNSLYHPYINKDGKYVSGPAALNHYIYTVIGGLQNYHDETGEEYIRAFVKEHSDSVHEELAKKAKKRRFRVVS